MTTHSYYVLDVIPLATVPLSAPQILSYYSAEEVPRGALVRITFRNREVNAVVEQCAPIEERKLAIRSGEFQLQQIGRVLTSSPVLTESQFQLAATIVRRYVNPVGATVRAFIPASLQRRKTPPSSLPEIQTGRPGQTQPSTPLLLWGTERSGSYGEYIRNGLREGSVLLLVPERHHIEPWRQWAERTFSDVPLHTYHGDLTARPEMDTWSAVAEEESAIVVGTGGAAFLPFRALGAIIVDEEQHSAFEAWGRTPRFNMRDIAHEEAQLYRAHLVFGTPLPTVESYARACAREEDTDSTYRLEHKSDAEEPFGSLEIVDLRDELMGDTETLISPALKRAVRASLDDGNNAILFTHRRGMATALECRECGHTIYCGNCDAPMVQHIKNGRPQLLCHHCLTTADPPETCPECGGAHIKHMGRGTERLADSVTDMFPRATVLRLDSDSAPSRKEQEHIIQQFADNRPAVLVATQLLFSHIEALHACAPLLSGIPLVDSMLNFPEYRTRERVFQRLARLCDISERCIVQTFTPDMPFFDAVRDNAPGDFLDEEMNTRKALAYPPFGDIIQLQGGHANEKAARSSAYRLKSALEQTLPGRVTILGPTPGFIPRVGNKYVWQILLKCADDCGSIKARVARMLPRNWQIYVNPESLL